VNKSIAPEREDRSHGIDDQMFVEDGKAGEIFKFSRDRQLPGGSPTMDQEQFHRCRVTVGSAPEIERSFSTQLHANGTFVAAKRAASVSVLRPDRLSSPKSSTTASQCSWSFRNPSGDGLFPELPDLSLLKSFMIDGRKGQKRSFVVSWEKSNGMMAA